jgi:hypothetical protein
MMNLEVMFGRLEFVWQRNTPSFLTAPSDPHWSDIDIVEYSILPP